LSGFFDRFIDGVFDMVSSNTKSSNHLIHTQFLLVLWDEGGAGIQKGKVNERFSGRVAEANAACAALVESGAIELSADGRLRFLTLTDEGKAVLAGALAGGEFQFEVQIGGKMANALLKWFRSGVVPVGGAKVAEPIESYEVFKGVVLEIFDRLDRDFNMDNLVPIYRIRREIGERVSRSEFSDWLMEMQSNDVLQLLEGSVEDNHASKLEDSVQTKLGKLRCYVKRINA
jgi:hypothetical protein